MQSQVQMLKIREIQWKSVQQKIQITDLGSSRDKIPEISLVVFSTISIADSTCSNVTADRNSIRVSFIESDESDNDHQVKHPVGNDEDLR